MNFKLRINGKMLLNILGITIVVYVTALSYAAFQLRSISYKNTHLVFEAEIIQISNEAQIKFNSYIEAVSVLAEMFSNYSEFPEDKQDELISEMLTKLLEKNHNYTSLFTIWEPGALNSSFIDSINFKNGAYQSIFLKQDDAAVRLSSDLIDALLAYRGDLYNQVKSSFSPMVIEPFVYANSFNNKSELICRVLVPIIKDDTFYGLVGADIPMAFMQQKYSKMRPMGDGNAFLISNSGKFLAHPDEKYLGKSIAEYAPDLDQRFGLTEIVKTGGVINFKAIEPISEDKSVIALNPIKIANTNTPWAFGMTISLKSMYKQANRTFTYAVLIGLIGLVIISIVIWIIALTISNPIVKTTNTLIELSRGNIRDVKKVKFAFNDEISDMAEGTNKLVEGLNAAAKFAQQIGEGHLDIDYKKLGENDALGTSLITMQKSLKVAKQAEELKRAEDEKRNWVTHGLAKFGEVIRQHNEDMGKFTLNIIRNIIDYTGVAQVAMYVNQQIEDEYSEGDSFDLKALMAYGKVVKLAKTFKNGQELLGRVTLENRTIYMEDLPVRYVALSPGMHEEKRPTNLLIAPININDNALGVIELLSFKRLEPHQIDFIEKLCENIASVVASVKTNLRTEKLLSQSQQQADELAQHEEEMRQNLEEMEATSEEANKRQEELKSYLKALKGSILMAELDLKGRIVDISPAMSLVYGASIENMRGKFYDAFVAQNKESQDEFSVFWESLLKNGSSKRMQKFKQRQKETVLLESYFVVEMEGVMPKVIVSAIDKTREKELNEELEKELRKRNMKT